MGTQLLSIDPAIRIAAGGGNRNTQSSHEWSSIHVGAYNRVVKDVFIMRIVCSTFASLFFGCKNVKGTDLISGMT